ncbi:MAG: S41 family peptidase [Chloroflexota bacterium]|nr:S41 family peptidase [Chloroflexota bacterium]
MQQRRYQIAAFLATIFFVSAAFVAGWTTFWAVERLPYELPFFSDLNAISPEVAAEVATEEAEDEMALFWEAMTLLDEHYYNQEELPRDDEITHAAVEGVIDATGDPHSGFLDPERTRIVETSLEGEFEGIGATVEMSEEGLVIVSPFPDTPAENAGLRPGDLVVEVDGTPTQGLDVSEAVAMVRGPEGSTVNLKVRRQGHPELLDFNVTRGTIVIPIVSTQLLEPQGIPPIGYIRLHDFGGRSVEQFTEGVQSLLDQGAERLIVDLRSNPGGFLQAAVDITSQFISEGIILSERGSNGRDNVYQAEGGGIATDVPLVVLINQGSASASEIFAGAIRDTGRGTLIGETTFGKGSVQVTRTLSDGSSLRITIARWFTPDGTAIHEVGVEPDIPVAWDFTKRTYLEDIGVPVDVVEEGLLVVEPYPNSPATEAGLQEGDIIVEVDRIPTRDITAGDVIPLGQGPEGSEARLTVQRPGVDEPLTFTIPRTYVDTLSQGDPQLEAAIEFFRQQQQ